MLIAPGKGFVFLAMPKTGSTSIERAFRPYAQMAQYKSPAIKHTKYAGFQRYLQPFLASKGFERESYEVVCVFREPIDWLSSWWRYRSREEISDPSHRAHVNYAGNVSFEEFAYAFMEENARFAKVGRPSQFVRPRPNQSEMERIFRYDRLDLLVEFLCEKVGEEVKVGLSNVSPKMSHSLSEKCEKDLRAFFEPEYRIYKKAIGG